MKATGRDVSSRVTAEELSGTPGGGLEPVSPGVVGAGFALTPGETGAGVAPPAAGAAAGVCAKTGSGCAASTAKNRPKASSTPSERLMLPILMYRSKIVVRAKGLHS